MPSITALKSHDKVLFKVTANLDIKLLKGLMGMEVKADVMEEVSKRGSSPPNCECKCYGCTPCEAIQVPSTSSRRSHLGVQYANYEPESWKCKCGPSLYSP
ncbi:hypothetical protein VNO78_02017 [Psophocarpus tetragonolobus]|uniref:Epidermal patterning factor-like protein n=1 Tax=Psophocarpus tetragonolobus TaxID=3891 RepID=A0AAN9SYF7_PSOTE